MDDKVARKIADLQRDLLKFKTGQRTQGDSANYYVVEYMPGWLVSSNFMIRDHTIKCIPYNNSEHAIFMPQMTVRDSWSVNGTAVAGRSLCYKQDIITWEQIRVTPEDIANEAYAAGVSKGFVIFSNVDFYIETSYIDTTYNF